MLKIGLIHEGKVPADSRVALSPEQCKWINDNEEGMQVTVQSSAGRCYSDDEYRKAGVEVLPTVEDADLLLGIKEVPKEQLIPGKHYMFFSHTKKLQPYNQAMLKEAVRKNITLTDYECLEHKDGTRIIGFGFFAGVVGAHNGMMAWGNRTGAFSLKRVHTLKNLEQLIHLSLIHI